MSYFSSLPMTSGFLYFFFFFRRCYCVLLSLSLPFPQTLTNLLLSPFFLVEFYTPILFLFLHFSFVVVTYSTPRSKLLWRVGILSPKCTISWQCMSFDFYFFLTHFFSIFLSLFPSFPHHSTLRQTVTISISLHIYHFTTAISQPKLKCRFSNAHFCPDTIGH